MDREGPGWEEDLRFWSSRFLNSMNCSNFSCPGLNDLILVRVGCLGGVWAGTLIWETWLIRYMMAKN